MTDEQSDLDRLSVLDPQTITAIHNRYYPEVYRLARYRLGDETLAEDITAEVFVRLLEAVHAGRGPHTNLRGWLIATTTNIIHDHFRKTYTRPIEPLYEDIHSEDAGPLERAETRERQRTVRAALVKLTTEQQQVIALRFGSGYSLEETASLMGKKANAIKALQFRALASLRRHIGNELI